MSHHRNQEWIKSCLQYCIYLFDGSVWQVSHAVLPGQHETTIAQSTPGRRRHLVWRIVLPVQGIAFISIFLDCISSMWQRRWNALTRSYFCLPPKEIQRNPKKSCMQCRTACGPKRAAVYLPETKDTSTRLRQEGQATTVDMTGLMASTELLCVKLAEARACCSSAKDNKDVGSLNTCPAIFQCYHLSTPKHPKHLVSCNGYFMLFLWISPVVPS